MKKDKVEFLSSLPSEWPNDLLPQIQRLVKESNRKVVVLDDDPTGTQTVHDVTVLTRWTVDDLVTALREPEPIVYILTNSRSFPLENAQGINREIVTNLNTACQLTHREFVVVSRSDSTLRGHFPGEVDAIIGELGAAPDGVLIVPFFLEGGRFTIDDVHYVAEGDWLVPTSDTEYAHDVTFGYQNSNLKYWVCEKFKGRVTPDDISSISLTNIRRGGPLAVKEQLLQIRDGQICVVNAASYRDLEIFVMGLLLAEAQGKVFVYRTAASFVRVRGGQKPEPLLTNQAIAGYVGSKPGLIVAGSYIKKSSAQLEEVRKLQGITSLEVQAEELMSSPSRENEIIRITELANQSLSKGKDTLIFTSRKLVTASSGATQLQIGQSISSSLVEIVKGISERPGWVIAKGGITSSDIATQGLNVKRATVIGQAIPGIPVWVTGGESRWPGLIYIVFPGNVGGPDTMVEMIRFLNGNYPSSTDR